MDNFAFMSLSEEDAFKVGYQAGIKATLKFGTVNAPKPRYENLALKKAKGK